MASRRLPLLIAIWYFYVPVLIWMAVIFLLSNQPTFGTSGHISLSQFILRKGAHVGEYFVLGLLSIRLFQFHFSGSHAASAGAVLVSLLYALSDEAHQLFVTGRQGRISDVGIDIFGILFSLIFAFAVLPLWERMRRNA